MPEQSPVYLSAPLELRVAKNEDKTPSEFSGTAYSGGIVPGYYETVIDLASATVDASMPILLQHKHTANIGIASQITKNNALEISGQLFTEIDEDARKVALKAQAGFPYQMSIGVFGGKWKYYGEQDAVMVNGQTFNGPVDVLYGGHIRETSIVTLGADPNTGVDIFSQDALSRAVQIALTQQKENSMPDPNKDQAALEQRIAELETALSAAETSRDEAQAALAKHQSDTRLSAVKAMLEASGIEFSDDAAAPYLEMTDTNFELVKKQLTAQKPAPGNEQSHNPALFKDTATAYPGGNSDQSQALDFSAIYANRARQATGA